MEKLRAVLLTRTNRFSGALMAQTLGAEGVLLAGIVAERRMSLVVGKKGIWAAGRDILARHGWRAVVAKLWESVLPRKGKQVSSIEDWAAAARVPLYLVDDHNSPASQAILRALAPDILVLCNTRKIAPATFSIAPRGALNLHLSLLPRYAGLDGIFWALYHREKELGFSIHRVAEKLDAGDLLYQEKITPEQAPDEDALYEDLIARGCRAMARVVLDLDGFERDSRKQDPAQMSYFSWPAPHQRQWYRRYRRELFQGEPLKVLHLITRMVRGGAQENTLATVVGLRARGMDASLATGPSEGPEGSMEKDIAAAGIPCVPVQRLVREPSLWKDLGTLVWLTRWMRKEKFLIVHTHTSKAGTLGRLAAWMAGVPVVVHTPHGHVFGGYFSSAVTRWFARIERWLARRTDRLIALTEKEKEEHLALGIGTQAQFAVIPSGVKTEDFDPERSRMAGLAVRREFDIPENAKVIGTVARLVPVKGVEYLLRAFAQLDPNANVYCLITGDGMDRQVLEKLAQECSITPRVIFAGYRKDVPAMLSAMDIFVQPSLNEGMGRAIVQAGLMRKPIAASAVSGIQDLIQSGQNGILVPPADPGALAQALGRLLAEPALAEAMGSRARQAFLPRYGEERMVEDIAALYEDVLKSRGIPLNWLRTAGPRGEARAANLYAINGREYEKLSC